MLKFTKMSFMLVEIPNDLVKLVQTEGMSIIQALESILDLNEETIEVLEEALEKRPRVANQD
ncbi:hypothetical protein [Helicobacter salomonis]|uniref:hypothetical protein n=1 Tax=Helicobacter salomonis TaxID=56878 RepID=UPI000CF05EC0|nr:hypothetical protein [Helicobacter salomonis]